MLFPIFHDKVLAKVIREKLNHLIIVISVCHSQPWYSQLLCMSKQNSLLLPQVENLFVNPLGKSEKEKTG